MRGDDAYNILNKKIKNQSERIKETVNEYLKENPVQSGATEEQAQQIKQNTDDVASLKEDLSNKITKFYASNQGETHITDSDNGKIMDMILYGKSKQKQYSGKNLINSDEYYSEYKQSDGTYKGAAKVFNAISVPISKYIGTQITVSCKVTVPPNTTFVLIEATINETVIRGNRIESGKSGVIAVKISPKTESDIIKITYGTGGGGIIVVSEFQIEKGSEPTTYEPYTGGQPSPSPDYPQEIKSVVNPTIKICGKNLFDSKKFPIILNRGIDTNTGNIYQLTSGKYCATEKYIPFPYSGKKISFNASMSLCAYDQDYKFISSVNKNNGRVPSGTMYVRFDIKIEDKDKVQIELSENTTTYEPYKEQTIQLLITLNAIPVSSDGNVTINEQQYIADYVDVERGKLVKMVDSSKLDNTQSIIGKIEWLLAEPQEIDLTQEEVQALKALATYYPTTNISVNSKQLDGYAVFNYPISMKNGWNYVKQQIGDTREYIYNMDARTQDTDLHAAEAYVNSEYAVVLTELEV